MNIRLENDRLKVIINTLGAEIMSVMDNAGREYIWRGDPDVWKYRAPILFPVCGDLNDSCYTYEGKKYSLPRHGFARDMEFEAGIAEDTSGGGRKVTFVLRSDNETLEMYPFEFVLSVTYELYDNALTVSYRVENESAGEMYFSIGSHEGYMIPGGFRKHNVFIDEIVPLIDDYFMGEQDTLVYEDPEFRTAYIKQYPGRILVTVDFDDISSFSIWSKPGAEFLCLEPWHGIPEKKGADPDITKKPGFIRLEEGSVFESAHTIYFG